MVGFTRQQLSSLGLKDTAPSMMLSELVEDLCAQTPLGKFIFINKF
jgi:hypothetical protein